MMIAQAEAQQRRHDYTPARSSSSTRPTRPPPRARRRRRGRGRARRPHPERWAEYERLDLEQRACASPTACCSGPRASPRARGPREPGVTAVVSLVDDAPARLPGVEWRGFPLPDASSAAPKLAKALPSILARGAPRARGHTVLLHRASRAARPRPRRARIDRRAAAAADAAADTAQAATTTHARGRAARGVRASLISGPSFARTTALPRAARLAGVAMSARTKRSVRACASSHRLSISPTF